jgi:acyl-CoA thioester hydrolase
VSELPPGSELPRAPALPAYRVEIQPDWIDYNGHLRDAYYIVALSYAVDDVMDHLGLGAAYRERTHCTLYTLELHIHYLHEIKSSDELSVVTSVLDCDRKRIHAACDFLCPRIEGPAATADLMLLHVHQGAKPASASFPPEVSQRLEALKLTPAALAARGLGSRKIELKRRP